MEKLWHKIEFSPAYDRRGEGYGQGCVQMTFLVTGPLGAIQFRLMTGWYPNVIGKPELGWQELGMSRSRSGSDFAPMPMDLGYHSPTPRYDGQSLMSDRCSVLDGPCYYDGSTLNADKPFAILVHEGDEALWKFLDDYYRETFEESEVLA